MPDNADLLANAASALDDAGDKLLSVIHSPDLSANEQAAASNLAASARSLAQRVRALRPVVAAARAKRAASPVPAAVNLATERVDDGIADLQAIDPDTIANGAELQRLITAASNLSSTIATAVGRHAPAPPPLR